MHVCIQDLKARVCRYSKGNVWQLMATKYLFFCSGVESDPSNESFVSPSTDLQLQSLPSSSAISPIPHDQRNRDSAITEEELSSSLAQLNLQEESSTQEEMQFTERHDGVQENDHREPSVNASNTEQGLTEFHQNMRRVD